MTDRLWDHQWDAIAAAARASAQGAGAGLWVIPTGGGKTRAFLTLARELGWPTLVLVHRDELVRQTVDAAHACWPDASVGVVQRRRDEWAYRDVVVASVRSLRQARLARIPSDHFGLIIADEAHHVPAPAWRAVLAHFRPRFLLGASATPDRLDGRGLAPWFGPTIYQYGLREAIEAGVLVRLRQFAVTTGVVLDGVGLRAGDFAAGELSAAVATEARNRAIAASYLEMAPDRRAIAFGVDLNHVAQLRDEFLAAGVSTASVTGATPVRERRRTLDAFAAGDFRVLVNCEVCTEGFDDRGVGCVIMARPTRSRALYQQCVGRGLRANPGGTKRDCLVLDVTDNCRRHRLVTAFDLFGIEGVVNARGEDVLEVADRSRRSADATVLPRHEIALPGPVVWDAEEVCSLGSRRPNEATIPVGHCSLADYLMKVNRAVAFGPTPKQRWFLESRGISSSNYSKQEAAALIGRLKEEEERRELAA